ncbi:MAG: Bug family tripartite tricarboxylate transporter substrate binding protein, partial [Chloroflexota bacterium]|jgi:putative tricarboxylic transport membrane protein
VVALLGGNVDAISCNPSEVIGQVQAGTVNVIGTASEKRSPFLPDTPTMKESGLDFTFNSFRGVVAPAGISDEVVKYWDDAFAKLKDDPEWKEAVKTNTNVEFYMNSAEFKTYLEELEQFYRQVLDEMGVLKK